MKEILEKGQVKYLARLDRTKRTIVWAELGAARTKSSRIESASLYTNKKKNPPCHFLLTRS
jgi:hypothetical protein